MNEIIELAEEVYASLGPGFSERVYHNAMEVQLRIHNMTYETERLIEIKFKDHLVGHIRADLIVNNNIVVELKVGNTIKDEHIAQCNMYMKYLNFSSGVIISFPLTKERGIEIVECVKQTRVEYSQQKVGSGQSLSSDDNVLYDKLRAKRSELARLNNLPPYVIATNKSLMSMVAIKPKSSEQLKDVYGFGSYKIEKYGDEFLSVFISDYP